jgi:hypothetical protein
MPETSTRFRVLIASPGDCQEERVALADALTRWNDVYGSRSGLELQPNLWEEDTQPELGDRPQGMINRQLVDRADILIAVFWKRLGTPTSVAPSGTAEEIHRFLQSGRPALVYFSRRPADLGDVDPRQLVALREYRQQIERIGLVGEFSTVVELREKVQKHMGILIDKLQQSRSSRGASKLSPFERVKVQEDLNATQPSREQLYAVKSPEDADYEIVFDPRDSA